MSRTEASQADSANHSPTTKHSIGFTTATFLVVANMIGVGVFTSSGFSLADLKSASYVWLAWLVAGIIALCGAVSYAALGQHFRQSGGEYLFLSRSVHPVAGFIAGWVSLTAGFSGAISLAARGFSTYFLPVINPNWNSDQDPKLYMGASIAVIGVAALCHSLKVGIGVMTQNILVAMKILLIAILICVALTAPTIPTETANFDIRKFAVAIMWISFSYIGYNAVVYAASEVRDVERTLPRSTIFGTLLVTMIYLLLNYIFVFKVPGSEIAGKADVAAICARYVGGPSLETFTRLIISLSLVTSVFAMIMIGPRVYAMMAQDRYLPRFLRDGSSPIAIWFQAILAIMVTSVVQFQDLLGYLGFTLSLSSALSICTLFVLKHRGKKIYVPLWPLPPLVFIVATVALSLISLTIKPYELLAAVITIVVGIALHYAITSQQRTSQ